jgi:hypothetical protein
MEKEGDLAENNSFTSYRIYNSYIAKWLSLDPLSRTKPFVSVYNSMSNSPIGKKDPFGDDDYYDEKGRLIYHTENGTNNIRVLLRSDFDAYDKKRYEDYAKTQPQGKAMKQPVWKLGNPPQLEKLNALSVEVKVQAKVDQEAVMSQLEKSTADDAEKREDSGNIILEINKDPKTKKITSASLYIEVDKGATRSKNYVLSPDYSFLEDDPSIRYVKNGKFNKILIGGIHTHPQLGQSTHGPSTPENAYDKKYVDTSTSKECSCDEFVLDNDLFKATPTGGTSKLDRATFNVAREALKTHASTH